MVSSQAWLFSVEFMCGQVLWNWDTLQTQPNTLYPWSAQPGVGMGSPVVLWDHFGHTLAAMVSLWNLLALPWRWTVWNYFLLLWSYCPTPHPCHTFSLPLATPEQKRWHVWDGLVIRDGLIGIPGIISARLACSFEKWLQRQSLHWKHRGLES